MVQDMTEGLRPSRKKEEGRRKKEEGRSGLGLGGFNVNNNTFQTSSKPNLKTYSLSLNLGRISWEGRTIHPFAPIRHRREN